MSETLPRGALVRIGALLRAAGLPDRWLAVERLGAGRHHHTLKVTQVGRALVLRLPGTAPRPPASLTAGAVLQRAAAARGIAPPLVYLDERDGASVSEWLAGESPTVASLQAPDVAAAVGRRIAEVQSLDVNLPVLDLAAAVSGYSVALAADAAIDLEVARRLQRLERLLRPASASLRPAHGDLVVGNLLQAPAGLMLLDWEYAGLADPRFDAATVIGLHGLGKEARRALLAAAGLADDEALVRQVELAVLLAWAWAAAGVASHPADARARAWLARAEALLSEDAPG